MGANPLLTSDKIIVFFDSNCLLCSRLIDVLLKYDKGNLFYSGFESRVAEELLAENLRVEPQTIIIYTGGKLLIKSTAIFHLIKEMGFPWTFLNIFQVLPTKFNDFIYNVIARKRISWFGRSESCYLPSEDQKSRFFD